MHDGKTIRGRRAPLRLAVLVALLGLSACAQYQIRVPDSDPARDAYEQKTLHAYLWGSTLDPQALGAECQGEGINDIFIDRSFGHDLASVLTLGIWMPIDVRYRCKAGAIDGGAFPSTPSPSSTTD